MSADPLRVAILVKALPLHQPGGLENHSWDLARGLADAGHRVTVVTTAHPGEPGRDQREEQGVAIRHCPAAPPGRNSMAFFRATAGWAQREAKEFDLVHAQGFAGKSLRGLPVPLVTTVHGTVWSETPLHRAIRPMLTWGERLAALWRFRGRTLLGRAMHRAWARSDRLIVDSDFTRRELLRRWPAWEARIDVVPLGTRLPADLPDRDDPPRGRPLRLLSVGRLVKEKGLGDLIAALAQGSLRDRFELKIAGDGPYRGRLERMVDKHGLEGRVFVLGRVDEEQLRCLWGEADLFVNPEWSQPAFGLVTVEAMGWGLPVVGTRTGATPELVTEQTGRLVPPGRPEALGAALAGLAENPQALSAMRRAARQRAETFTIEAMAEGTAAVYRRALAG